MGAAGSAIADIGAHVIRQIRMGSTCFLHALIACGTVYVLAQQGACVSEQGVPWQDIPWTIQVFVNRHSPTAAVISLWNADHISCALQTGRHAHARVSL